MLEYKAVRDKYLRDLEKFWDVEASFVGHLSFDTVEVCDMFMSFTDVRYVVDHKVPFEKYYEWYDYDLGIEYGKALGKQDAVSISLEHWMMGFPDSHKVKKEVLKAWEKEYFEMIP